MKTAEDKAQLCRLLRTALPAASAILIAFEKTCLRVLTDTGGTAGLLAG